MNGKLEVCLALSIFNFTIQHISDTDEIAKGTSKADLAAAKQAEAGMSCSSSFLQSVAPNLPPWTYIKDTLTKSYELGSIEV
jgi:hypothetical protein